MTFWNTLGVWGVEKGKPLILKLAKVALEVHATQIVVERLLSNKGVILSPLRFCTKESILQGILLAICYEMFDRRQQRLSFFFFFFFHGSLARFLAMASPTFFLFRGFS
jgi:hypothetical protein